MIVVDVGCATHGSEESMQKLIDRFQPETLYGFDPHATEGVSRIGDTPVVQYACAAWIEDGYVSWRPNVTRSCVVAAHESAATVACVDFAAWLRPHVDAGPVIVKLDCEGAEFALLARLREWGLLDRLERLLVEWHLGCPFEEWT